jgi:tetratricopeptide (TPR) repeat protein
MSVAAMMDRASELAGSGDRRGAIEMLDRVIARAPSALAHYQRGLVCCELKRHPEAIADLDRSLELSPRFAAALTERGLAYVHAGDPESGLRDYDASIVADPSYWLAYENRANVYLMTARWADVVASLDIGLRLQPRAEMRYSRGVAHEMLGELARARSDYQIAVKAAPNSEAGFHARKRLSQLPAEAHALPEPSTDWVRWPVLTGVTMRDTVGELAHKVVAAQAFYVRIDQDEGAPEFATIYGRFGLRRRLSTLADAIGPRILTLELAQVPDLFTTSLPTVPDVPRDDRTSLSIETETLHVATKGDEVIGAISQGLAYHAVHEPVAVFADPPAFDRDEHGRHARQCSSCQRPLAYFTPTFEPATDPSSARDRGMLAGFACPSCGASPILDWVEDRMRPGEWSRAGFLGDGERLRDVIARDAQSLASLGIEAAQIAHALDRLLAQAMATSRDRIARAQVALLRDMHRKGQQGFPGLARIPIGATLDALEAQLRAGREVPADRGVRVGEHQVFLDVYLDYQHCPFTIAHRPWSDEAPRRVMIQRREPDFAYVTEPIDLALPCRDHHTYRHANLEFLIVYTSTRQALRGAGLLAHLIGEHQFFEGPGSPFRLDPERAARVLCLAPVTP